MLPACATGGIFSKCLAALNYCLWLLESAGMLLTTDISFDVKLFWGVQLNVKMVYTSLELPMLDLVFFLFYFLLCRFFEPSLTKSGIKLT